MSATKSLLDDLMLNGRVEKHLKSGLQVAYAYARVSSDMQDDRGSTIDYQLQEIRKFAEKKGFKLVKEFREVGSAYDEPLKRPVFNEMLRKADTEEIDAIMVHDFSRFIRKGVEGMHLKKDLAKNGIALISVTDPELDPEAEASELIENVIFWNNEYYSKQISKHTKKGCAKNAKTRDPETGWCYWNGGQPIWGYKIVKVNMGTDSSGKQINKSLIVTDDTVVQGKPVCEWVKYCLEELAAKGASLMKLTDFCNDQKLPARRNEYWQTTTWNTLLQRHILMKYAGYGIWNIHRKDGSKRPVEDWIIEENAHEALISENTVRTILKLRSIKSEEHSFDKGFSRSKNSPYLLSGGLFVCGRCGKNMQGIRKQGYAYYQCGSQPSRKGRGCGPLVLVPKGYVENEVVKGLEELLDKISHDRRFVTEVNRGMRKKHEEYSGFDPQADRKIKNLEQKIEGLFDAIASGGLKDIELANNQIEKWKREKEKIEGTQHISGRVPRFDPKAAKEIKRQLKELFEEGKPQKVKSFLRIFVAKIELAPEKQGFKISYAVPEPLVHSIIAGAVYAILQQNAPRQWLKSFRGPIQVNNLKVYRSFGLDEI